MNRRRFIGTMGVIFVMPFIPGCSRRLPSYRYRMTVIVDTPQGERIGSSVIEVRTHESASFPAPEAGGIRTRIHGEAVAVDLPGGETLFALLTGGPDRTVGAGGYAWALLPARPDPGGDADALANNMRALRQVEGTAELQPYQMPMLVRFGDIDDPTSIERVDPDNLAESFGPGISLRAITVEITDDAVTEGMAERLAWLDNLERYRRDPDNPFTNTLPREISGLRSK